MENGIIIRIFVVILLALALLLHFLLNNNDTKQTIEHKKTESPKYSIADVDSVVDKVLYKFHISKNQIKRNEIRFAEIDFVRIEKRINVMNDSLSLLINLELKQMMDYYGLKVSGTENFKEKITTLYIIDKGTVLQSIGLKSKK